MNVGLLVKRLRGEGFRPFTLRLTDGRALAVPHPEFIAVGRHAVVVMDAEGFPTHVDLLHIVSVDEAPLGRRGRNSEGSGPS